MHSFELDVFSPAEHRRVEVHEGAEGLKSMQQLAVAMAPALIMG